MPTSPRPVEVPAELRMLLDAHDEARTKFDTLSPSNRREYAMWISEAKKPETREKRLAQVVELLVAGRKTPQRPNDELGNSKAPVLQKLKVKPGERAIAVNAPKGLGSTLGLQSGQKGDVVVAFARNSGELAKVVAAAAKAAGDEGRVWVAYPKKSSGIETDLSRDANWDALHDAGFDFVMLISLDAQWTAARVKRV